MASFVGFELSAGESIVVGVVFEIIQKKVMPARRSRITPGRRPCRKELELSDISRTATLSGHYKV